MWWNHGAVECADNFAFLSSFIDVNECAKDNLLCGSEAKCKNKPATYECVCKKGFSLHKANKKCLGEYFYFSPLKYFRNIGRVFF